VNLEAALVWGNIRMDKSSAGCADGCGGLASGCGIGCSILLLFLLLMGWLIMDNQSHLERQGSGQTTEYP
jgi:hypothetical protein